MTAVEGKLEILREGAIKGIQVEVENALQLPASERKSHKHTLYFFDFLSATFKKLVVRAFSIYYETRSQLKPTTPKSGAQGTEEGQRSSSEQNSTDGKH